MEGIYGASSFIETKALCLSILVVLLIWAFKRYVDGPTYRVPQISLKGKNAVVTGGSAGIGFETAKQLALLGCHVIIGGRNRQNAEHCIKQIRALDSAASVDFIPLDLADRASIQSFAAIIREERIDYLVNNAGVMGIPSRKLTKEAVEMHWGVNHLAHFYLTYLLWPKLARSDFFRVVNVSSRGHRWYIGFFQTVQLDFDNINFDRHYDPQMAYSRSKLYNVLFTRALASKIDPSKGLVVSLHPGVVRTDILRQMTGNGFVGLLFKVVLQAVWPLWWLVSKSAKQGTMTSLYALLSEQVQNGCYYVECKRADENPNVNAQNWEHLWRISEQYAKVQFRPDYK